MERRMIVGSEMVGFGGEDFEGMVTGGARVDVGSLSDSGEIVKSVWSMDVGLFRSDVELVGGVRLAVGLETAGDLAVVLAL